MNASSIKFKVLTLISGIGLFFFSLLVFYAPQQSEKLASNILHKDAEFIAGLLAENLTLGMQTMILDNGESLEQTLKLLNKQQENQIKTISSVKIFDADMNYIKGLNNGENKSSSFSTSSQMEFKENEMTIAAWAPMKDSDKTLLGFVEIDFSKKYLLDNAHSNSFSSLIIAGIALALTTIIGFFIVTPVLKSLGKLTQAAKEVATGDIDVRIDIHSRDEIGTLAESLREMIENQKTKILVAQEIAKGNINVEVKILSEKDILGKAMIQMKESITTLFKDVSSLANHAISGQLTERAKDSVYAGEYQNIVKGINSILDAVVIPINEAISVTERLASRDLTTRMDGDYQGDYAKLKQILNSAVDNLDQALQQVSASSQEVNSASDQIRTGSQSLSNVASEQASSLEEISSSLKEMAMITKQNTANTKEARGMSESAHTSTIDGLDSMQRLSDVMDKIKVSSDETSKVVKTIDDIAFQTNLLALNAAVEAARAGEAGKGFAVVAEEVRNLAMRSAEAAKNTAQLIEESVKNAENGVEVNSVVAKNLENINEQVRKVKEVINEISTASEQQRMGIEQINIAVDQLNQLTQQNAANSEESASTAVELSNQANNMMNMVRSFQLSYGSSRIQVVEDKSIKATQNEFEDSFF